MRSLSFEETAFGLLSERLARRRTRHHRVPGHRGCQGQSKDSSRLRKPLTGPAEWYDKFRGNETQPDLSWSL